MPAIRGVYYNHPLTDEPGIWIWCSWGEKAIVGFSQERLDAIKLVGTAANREVQFKAAVEGGLLADCEHRLSLEGYTQEELEAKAADPPPCCTVDTDARELVVQPLVISITPLSLDAPRRLQIEVSDGAYTSSVKYG